MARKTRRKTRRRVKRKVKRGKTYKCEWCSKQVKRNSDYFLTFVGGSARVFHPVCYSKKARTGHYYWIYTPALEYTALGLFGVGAFLSGISLAAIHIRPEAAWFLLFGLLFLGTAIYQIMGLRHCREVRKDLG